MDEWLSASDGRPARVVTWIACASTQSHKVGTWVSTFKRRRTMKQSSKIFVGMDVHKESIDITLAEQDGEVSRFGTVGGDRTSLLKAVRKLTARGRTLVFVYEAGPCGFWIYRELTALGHACPVVSPSLIPRRSGDHVKTDRRDSENLARLARAGELTGVHGTPRGGARNPPARRAPAR